MSKTNYNPSKYQRSRNKMRSTSSIPPIIRKNTTQQGIDANASSLSSGFTNYSREKRSNDQMNEGNVTQPSVESNTGNKKSKFYRSRNDERDHRNKIISESTTKFCVFQITKFHCRNLIRKLESQEGIYCGLLHCNCKKKHDRHHGRMNVGDLFIHKDRIKNNECEYLLS